MTNKLLIYRWGAISEPLLCDALTENGYAYEEFKMKIKSYHADAEFALAFMQKLHSCGVKRVFSFDYFPLISMICEINQIPYISWIYDCPMTTLYSQTVKNKCNYIFCFDRMQCEEIKAIGAVNCFHYPLAGDIRWFEKAYERCLNHEAYQCDISFVGNLYNGDKNRYRSASFSPAIKAELEVLIEEQLKLYGTNIIPECLTDEIVKEVAKQCNLSLGPEYMISAKKLVEHAIGMEVSARERECMLKTVTKIGRLHMHTTSEIPKEISKDAIEINGYADYRTEVPLIFYNSKININVTSKTITSGVPQRIFDILSCGGFCITNYQQEIAEIFKEDEELVMYRSMDELAEKVNYYLLHEEERRAIAVKGKIAIKERFLLKDCFAKMLRMVEPEM